MPAPSRVAMGVGRPNFRSPSLLRPYVAQAAGPTVLWDSINKSSDVTISGGGLVATHTGGGANDASGRADTAIVNPSYWEAEVTADTGGVGFGIVNGSYDFTVGQWLGLKADGIGHYSDGTIYQDYNSIFTARFGGWPTFSVGNRIQVAFNPSTLKLWSRVNGGVWNNGGANDPATDTGGIDVNTSPIIMGTGPFYPGYNVFTGGSVVTLKAAPALWNNAAPSGFGQVGA